MNSPGGASLGASTRLGPGRPVSTTGAGVSSRPTSSLLPLTSGSPTSISTARSPVSPTANAGQSPGGQSQHEVLQNFFQSLLSSKDRSASGGASRGVALGATRANGPTTTTAPNNGSPEDNP